jgi:hypothetical protein
MGASMIRPARWPHVTRFLVQAHYGAAISCRAYNDCPSRAAQPSGPPRPVRPAQDPGSAHRDGALMRVCLLTLLILVACNDSRPHCHPDRNTESP